MCPEVISHLRCIPFANPFQVGSSHLADARDCETIVTLYALSIALPEPEADCFGCILLCQELLGAPSRSLGQAFAISVSYLSALVSKVYCASSPPKIENSSCLLNGSNHSLLVSPCLLLNGKIRMLLHPGLPTRISYQHRASSARPATSLIGLSLDAMRRLRTK